MGALNLTVDIEQEVVDVGFPIRLSAYFGAVLFEVFLFGLFTTLFIISVYVLVFLQEKPSSPNCPPNNTSTVIHTHAHTNANANTNSYGGRISTSTVPLTSPLPTPKSNIQLNEGRNKARTRTRYLLLATSILMYLIAVADMAYTLWLLFECLMGRIYPTNSGNQLIQVDDDDDEGNHGSLKALAMMEIEMDLDMGVMMMLMVKGRKQFRFRLLYPKYVFYVTNNLIAGALMLYRCIAVWKGASIGRKWLVGPGIVILVGVTVCGYALEGTSLKFVSKAWIYVSLTLIMNVLLTGLTAGRILYMTRKTYHLLPRFIKRRYIMTIAILIESGFLCVLYLALNLGFQKHPVANVILDCGGVQIIGMVPMIIIVQVGLGRTIVQEQEAKEEEMGSRSLDSEIRFNRRISLVRNEYSNENENGNGHGHARFLSDSVRPLMSEQELLGRSSLGISRPRSGLGSDEELV